MSHEGKLQRGEMWYAHRNADGNLPSDITSDSNKMKDVNYFLEEKAKVEEVSAPVEEPVEEKPKKETKSKGKK